MPFNLGALLLSSPRVGGADVSRIYLGADVIFDAGDITAPVVSGHTWDDVAGSGSLSVDEAGTLHLATYDSASGTPTPDGVGGWTGTTLETFSQAVTVGLNALTFTETLASTGATHFTYYIRDAAGNDSDPPIIQAYTPDIPAPGAWDVTDNSDGGYTVNASEAAPTISSVTDNGDGNYTVT